MVRYLFYTIGDLTYQSPLVFYSPSLVIKPLGNASAASYVLLTWQPSSALSPPLIVGNQQHRYGRMFSAKWRLYCDKGNWVKGTQVNGAVVNNPKAAHNQLSVLPTDSEGKALDVARHFSDKDGLLLAFV